jgi:chalcone isomerase-like protein
MTRFSLCRLATGVLLAGVLAASPALHAAEVAGVNVAESARVGGQELVLNGAGVRKRLVFKVYVAALYLPAKASSAAAIVDSAAPRRISMHLLREVDADSLVTALRDGIAANHSGSDMAALAPQVEQLATLMRALGTTKTGDVVGLDFSAAGVAVGFNGQPRGSVAGDAFAKALLRVWLGDKPVDAALKKALLGG